jgi:hypothetical protein
MSWIKKNILKSKCESPSKKSPSKKSPSKEFEKELKNILKKSKINHKTEIMKQESLKDAHIYCKINELSGQFSGPLLETYIKNKYKMTKNKASSCSGDLQCNKEDFEIKVSTGGKEHNIFNYVQLRINHNCEYILTAYYISNLNIKNLGDLFIFKLNKDKELILKYGGYAHGTIKKLGEITKEDLDNNENNKEYAIRPKYNSECWKKLLNYRINEIAI